MKRILLAVALAFGLGVVVGCGGGSDTKATNKKTEPTKPAASENKEKTSGGPGIKEDKKEEKKQEEKKEEKKQEEKKEEKKQEEKKEEKK
ncbi:MAG: hypothetical protein NZU63_07700 [Gemmataceae bacterium]|nr:hypothetical protein [Gemmataceae bacterium]MDW8244368.1 hypothetical protein [Thermogemmata sp.]